MIIRIRAPGGMRRIQDIFVWHFLPVDHKRRSELERVDDLFAADFLFVEPGQLRAALVHMEIPVLIDQQHIQEIHDRIPEDLSLAEAVLAAFAFCMGIAEIPVDSQNGVHPLGHRTAGRFDAPHKVGRIPGRSPQLARILDRHKSVEAVDLAEFVRMRDPGAVQVCTDGRIFIAEYLFRIRIPVEI